MANRKVKFQYFGVVRQEKQGNQWMGKGKLNIESWLDKLEAKNLTNKTIDLGDVKASIDKIGWFEKDKVWVLRLMKLREDNIPSIVKENKEAEAISLADDEYIGEGLHMLYDNSAGIALIQVNRFSLGMKRLEDFFTYIWETENERIKFRPIIDEAQYANKIRRNCRMIEINFANISRENDDEYKALGRIMNSFRNFYGVSGSIKIGLGKTRTGTLNIEEVNQTVESALDNASVVGLKLHVKDDDDRPTEVIDLFDNICNDIILFKLAAKKTLEYEYASNEMIHYYLEKKAHIVKLITP